jgi:hypothetical protein
VPRSDASAKARACDTMRDEAAVGKYDFSVCVTLTKPNANICSDKRAACDEVWRITAIRARRGTRR